MALLGLAHVALATPGSPRGGQEPAVDAGRGGQARSWLPGRSLSGYSDEEKREIALRYLLPRQWKQAGLSAQHFLVPDETLITVMRRYTREAGVRTLERLLGRLARKVALQFAEGRTEPVTVLPELLPEMLGAERVFLEEARKDLPPGVATGLAWTESGGDVL
jgi:ATP-dependent Lon protease